MAIDWSIINLDCLSNEDKGLYHRYSGWLAKDNLGIPIGKPKPKEWEEIMDNVLIHENMFEALIHKIGSRVHFETTDYRTIMLAEYLITWSTIPKAKHRLLVKQALRWCEDHNFEIPSSTVCVEYAKDVKRFFPILEEDKYMKTFYPIDDYKADKKYFKERYGIDPYPVDLSNSELDVSQFNGMPAKVDKAIATNQLWEAIAECQKSEMIPETEIFLDAKKAMARLELARYRYCVLNRICKTKRLSVGDKKYQLFVAMTNVLDTSIMYSIWDAIDTRIRVMNEWVDDNGLRGDSDE